MTAAVHKFTHCCIYNKGKHSKLRNKNKVTTVNKQTDKQEEIRKQRKQITKSKYLLL